MRELAPYIAPLLVLLIVLRRAGRAKRLRTANMWIIPALAVLATGSTLAREPFPAVVALGLFVLAALAGAGVGYFRSLAHRSGSQPGDGAGDEPGHPARHDF